MQALSAKSQRYKSRLPSQKSEKGNNNPLKGSSITKHSAPSKQENNIIKPFCSSGNDSRERITKRNKKLGKLSRKKGKKKGKLPPTEQENMPEFYNQRTLGSLHKQSAENNFKSEVQQPTVFQRQTSHTLLKHDPRLYRKLSPKQLNYSSEESEPCIITANTKLPNRLTSIQPCFGLESKLERDKSEERQYDKTNLSWLTEDNDDSDPAYADSAFIEDDGIDFEGGVKEFPPDLSQYFSTTIITSGGVREQERDVGSGGSYTSLLSSTRISNVTVRGRGSHKSTLVTHDLDELQNMTEDFSKVSNLDNCVNTTGIADKPNTYNSQFKPGTEDLCLKADWSTTSGVIPPADETSVDSSMSTSHIDDTTRNTKSSPHSETYASNTDGRGNFLYPVCEDVCENTKKPTRSNETTKGLEKEARWKRRSSVYFTCLEDTVFIPDLATRLNVKEKKTDRLSAEKKHAVTDLAWQHAVTDLDWQHAVTDLAWQNNQECPTSVKKPSNQATKETQHKRIDSVDLNESPKKAEIKQTQVEPGDNTPSNYSNDRHMSGQSLWYSPFSDDDLPDIDNLSITSESAMKTAHHPALVQLEHPSAFELYPQETFKKNNPDDIKKHCRNFQMGNFTEKVLSDHQPHGELQQNVIDLITSDSSSEDEFDNFMTKLKTPARNHPKHAALVQRREDRKFIDDSLTDTDDDEFYQSLTNRIFAKKTQVSTAIQQRSDPTHAKKTNVGGNSSKTTKVKTKEVQKFRDSSFQPKISNTNSKLIDISRDPSTKPKTKVASENLFISDYRNIGNALSTGRTKIKATNKQTTLSFLRSLDTKIPTGQLRHPDAHQYIVNFKKMKESYVKKLFRLFNEKVFDEKLPVSFSITWNARMTKTAGFCYNKIDKSIQPYGRAARIELSSKVCDCAERTRDTLIHELCHAAAWTISGYRDGHGQLWKQWTMLAMARLKDLPPISRCHTYVIQTKFTYKCERCCSEIGRHSKSIDMEKKVCGRCGGR